jgi:NO-binding membrane sensor protein with MHYT domain
VIGSLLALICTARARAAKDHPGRRARWLILAAWALGGTGIWVMHFMAMLGFDVPGSTVRYDIGTTVASWVAAIIIVGIGLFIVGYGRPGIAKILAGGLFTGVGVAGMHYTGMAAMRVGGSIGYDRRFVVGSVVIAIVAATVALWFTVHLSRGPVLAAAALIMGIAVNGMHFTGMAGLRVHLTGSDAQVHGVQAAVFIGPIMLFVLLVVITLAYAMLRSTADEAGSGWTYREPPPPPASPPVTGAPRARQTIQRSTRRG